MDQQQIMAKLATGELEVDESNIEGVLVALHAAEWRPSGARERAEQLRAAVKRAGIQIYDTYENTIWGYCPEITDDMRRAGQSVAEQAFENVRVPSDLVIGIFLAMHQVLATQLSLPEGGEVAHR